MTLLAIAILVATRWIGRLTYQTIMTQKRLVLLREHLGGAVWMNRQCQPIRAVPQRHTAQRPQGILQTLAQARETLRKA
jgi:hypothetical protein